jgi:CubicO group peptidase (beta-lactamase class C family)
MWSASKSASAAILGTAVQEGKLSLDDRMARFFPDLDLPNDPNEHYFNDVRIRDLLGMNASFEWNESYDGDPKQSQVVPFLYTEGYRDSARFALLRPFFPDPPGTRFNYSSGNVSIMQAVLKSIYGDKYPTMPWTSLYDKIGMHHMVMERDQADTFMASSYVWASVRDMAKLGFLYLNNGLWEDQAKVGQQPPSLSRIIPEEFVSMTRVLTPGEDQPSVTNQYIMEEGTYGGGAWWVNLPVPNHGIDRIYPQAPHDMFFAEGHYGQIILLMPSQDLIVARTGHDSEYDSKINHIAELAVQCFTP